MDEGGRTWALTLPTLLTKIIYIHTYIYRNMYLYNTSASFCLLYKCSEMVEIVLYNFLLKEIR